VVLQESTEGLHNGNNLNNQKAVSEPVFCSVHYSTSVTYRWLLICAQVRREDGKANVTQVTLVLCNAPMSELCRGVHAPHARGGTTNLFTPIHKLLEEYLGDHLWQQGQCLLITSVVKKKRNRVNDSRRRWEVDAPYQHARRSQC
jgi:hypothetical protein